MSKKCNHKCFECTFEDCVNNDNELTVTEITESMQRDMNYTNYGKVTRGRTKSKAMKARRYYG